MTTLKLFDNISRKSDVLPKLGYGLFWLALFVVSLGVGKNANAQIACSQTITADVVVFDSPTMFNRLGAQNPNYIMYALKRDVVHKSSVPVKGGQVCKLADGSDNDCTAGNVELRPDKRPRPLVVRSIAGACLDVTFTNWLDPVANPNNPVPNIPELVSNDQVAGRCAGFNATGTELRTGMKDDASMVGANAGANTGNSTAGESVCGPGMAAPNETRYYDLYTPHEGTFVVSSYGARLGSEGNAGNLGLGMFGALNVQPENTAGIYRSQVTEEELRLATTGFTDDDQPIIDYEATYPDMSPWSLEGKGGKPILNMLDGNELFHSDINAIIVGSEPNGMFPNDTYPLESTGTANNPQLPNRLEPFREFTSIYHDEQTNAQVYPKWYKDPVLSHTIHGVRDAFMINYGSGGIGSEIISNRLHTGPMHDCTDCAYEEFFLASQTVGDPAGLVAYPANTGIEQCDPRNILDAACWRQFDDGAGNLIVANPPLNDAGLDGEWGTDDDMNNYALYQEDPSNVHHGYTGDFVKIRNIHAGAFEQHIFHLHNHQWLFNPNDDNGNYLDAQEIMPGSGHTYELVNGGIGNRNKTAGDAIFHCHFYPHFAQGMWYHIRIQDVFERGTVLAVTGAEDPQNPAFEDDPGAETFFGDDPETEFDESLDDVIAAFHTAPFALRSGQPAAGSRALPDAELPDGWPIPAIVPLPGKPMPPMPSTVTVKPVDRGDYGVVAGRKPPNGLGQGPDSAQAVVYRDCTEQGAPAGCIPALGANGLLGGTGANADRTPGYPFWLAGNECGPGAGATDEVCDHGTVGQRMPTPVLDMLSEAAAKHADMPDSWANLGGGWDGGLPRHNLRGYTSGGLSADTNNRLDFRKVVKRAQPVYYPELGTDLEKVSMAHHAVRDHTSVANNLVGSGPLDVTAGNFVLNGSEAVPGGPFQDPCVDDRGVRVGSGDGQGHWFDGDNDQVTLNTRGVSGFDGENPRTYRIANVQIDAVFNKVGHHYSQERIIALWGDVDALIKKQMPPEPLVMRFNTFDCGKILHANLVPAEFELDDFQVRTPTDIIGQHIHLPKWDLTTNDGAANGWNYEDGTLSPIMVQERIHAIDVFNEDVLDQGANPDLVGLAQVETLPNPCNDDGTADCGTVGGLTDLTAVPHPFFGEGEMIQTSAGLEPEFKGARTTIQRIMVDPVVNVAGVDRGLGLTFSHDHYGPSTFQQIGLYSTILAEPAGSTWRHNESGRWLHTTGDGEPARTVTGPGGLTTADGGPTSWQAVILTDSAVTPDVPNHREFYFEMSDFQHAYNAGTFVGGDINGKPKLTTIIQPDPFNAAVATAPDIQNEWQNAVNPTLKLMHNGGFPAVVSAHGSCPGGAPGAEVQNDPNVPRPCAEAINIGHSSTWVINYRNEPVGYRVFDPDAKGPDNQDGTQTDGPAGDLALAFESRTDRAIPQLNTKFGDTPYPTGNAMPDSYCQGNDGDMINCDRNAGDPFTPIMRAYERDDVKIKIQVGATEEQHQATVHGIKWLSNGSGFGRSGNSGWRNFQSHGISEQFSLQVPMNPALQQAGQVVDYLYATDATRPGIWLGTWGILRSYGNQRQDLFPLPGNDKQNQKINFVNAGEFEGVCPKSAPLREFDITAVLANDVLPNNLNVTIPQLTDIDLASDPLNPQTFGEQTVGGPLDPEGGTLVYNRRQTEVLPGGGLPGGAGPLNDPTAMMYVRTEDLVAKVEADAPAACFNGPKGKNAYKFNPTLKGCNVDITGCQSDGGSWDPKQPTCPVILRDNVPVEPLVLRANAGDCIDVRLRNRLVAQAKDKNGKLVYESGGYPAFGRLADGSDPGYYNEDGQNVPMAEVKFDNPPDLAGWQDMMWGVTRRIQRPEGATEPGVLDQMYFFNNNLVRPGAHVGLHAQLVSYDASRDDGLRVGRNQRQSAEPGRTKTYRYYAGDLFYEEGVPGRNNRRNIAIHAAPIEFGASNLLSADRIKQPQKGLFGSLVIEPVGACHPDSEPSETCTPPALELVADGQGLEVDGEPSPTRQTRAQVTVDSPPGPAGSGGSYREALMIGHKIANLRWADGTAIRNHGQGELGVEGAEDSGHAGFNYGMEPSWFRFKLPPDAPSGNATAFGYGSIPNVQAFYANALVAGEGNSIPAIPGVSEADDPVTPVFRAEAGQATRMYVLNGASADRDGTFILHGHLWQRDPYVCTGNAMFATGPDAGEAADPEDAAVPLAGRCDPNARVPSSALGFNEQGKWMGSEEGMGHVFGHWPILFNAGGGNAANLTGCADSGACDFLFGDYAPNGNRNGQFGILRVQKPPQP